MSRRLPYIDLSYEEQDVKIQDVYTMSSLNAGPVHNAVRRMTELIDLENLEGYFEEYLLDSTQDHGINDFDALPEDNECGPTDTAEQHRAHFITIESYTKICFERPNEKLNEKEEPRPSKAKFEDNKNDARRKQRESTASRVTHLEKNAWKEYGKTIEKTNHYDRKNRSKRSWVVKFFCGVNQEFKWYSLKGKGVCLIVPMAISYVVLCIVLLPFVLAAAAISAFILCAGLCSYFSLATKKVGVSSDEDGDKSCLEAIWWWA